VRLYCGVILWGYTVRLYCEVILWETMGLYCGELWGYIVGNCGVILWGTLQVKFGWVVCGLYRQTARCGDGGRRFVCFRDRLIGMAWVVGSLWAVQTD
jgi:hypothetical protein